ncbi:MAG: PEP-CTERM sorting domain-containing protein [Leptolyngbyaceae cyanobacterium bins.59]|nr:PEP-CTERM sorting domain-containing protein [Leptolyngbyaceae cyanobacterium bins.59]
MKPFDQELKVMIRLGNKTFVSVFWGVISILGAIGLPSQALAARLVSPGGDTSVQILGGTAGYTSDLGLYAPYSKPLGTNREVGRTVYVGNFAKGTELLFGIYVRQTRYTFLMGPSSNNPDGLVHAVIHYVSPGVVKVGFEDLYGGGDRDYDDNNFYFYGVNITPTLNPFPKNLIANTGSLYKMSASAFDPEGGELIYDWDLDNDGKYDDYRGSSAEAMFDRPGKHTVGVRVSDEYGGYDYGVLQIEAVPEPSVVLGLLVSGLVGLGSLRRNASQGCGIDRLEGQ